MAATGNLRVVEGAAERPLTGAEVLDEVVALIDRRLPDVCPTDPARPHLERFRAAAAPLPSVLRLLQPASLLGLGAQRCELARDGASE
jgi:hypothetical protein